MESFLELLTELRNDLNQSYEMQDYDGIHFLRTSVSIFLSDVRKELNTVLDEAAQLAEDIDSGKYTATKTAAEAIREMKVS